MCVFLGSRISLHSLPSPTLSFHKPSDAELTYFLGAEIQKDERRFTSYFLPFFFFFGRNFGISPTNPFFLSSTYSSLSTLLSFSFYCSLTPVCHVFPSLLIFLFSRIFLSCSRKFLSLFLFISRQFVCRFLLKFLLLKWPFIHSW